MDGRTFLLTYIIIFIKNIPKSLEKALKITYTYIHSKNRATTIIEDFREQISEKISDCPNVFVLHTYVHTYV